MPKRANQRWRGQSLVEFALIAPIFFWLILGTIDLGRVVLMQSLIDHAVREAARAGIPIASGSSSSSVFTTLPTDLDNAAAPFGNQLTSCVMLAYSSALLSAPPTCANGTTSTSGGTAYGYVVVTASLPFHPVSGLFASSWNVTLSASSMMLFSP